MVFFFALENCDFSVLGFIEFSLWFSVFVNNDVGFSDFFGPLYFTVFLVLPKKLHPALALKPVIPRDGIKRSALSF